MGKTAKQWLEFYSSPEFQEKYIYEGNDLGAACTKDGTSILLWSPFAESVNLNLYTEGSDVPAYSTISMERQRNGVWEYKTKENLHGVYYDFALMIENEEVISADPYAKACGVNGQRSMVVDLRTTDPEGWSKDTPPAYDVERIIYELHVKEFSWQEAGGVPEETRGTYNAFLHADTTLNNDGVHPTGISWLKELGVTHVQLMPVYDYGSVDEAGDPQQFNWGYDPVNYNVPEGSYSSNASKGEVRVRELKGLVQSLHKQGFRVIMDVVYNHTYSLDSWLQKTVPWYFYRVKENGEVSNGSDCGNDVASERAMCRKYILDSVLYWAKEYHMDGFRFDLMGLLDVELMNQIQSELDAQFGRGEKLIFGEPWAARETAMDKDSVQALKANMYLLDEQIGMFCDDTRDAIKGSALRPEEPGFVNGEKYLEKQILDSVAAWCNVEQGTVLAPSQVITYVSSHDNQTLWDKLEATVQDETLRRNMYRLAAGIYMTCQGNLFFLSGEEFGRTKDGCEDSYNAPISLNRLDWEKAWKERELVEFYQGMIGLRKNLPGLCDKTKTAWKRVTKKWTKPGIAGFTLDNQSDTIQSNWKKILVVYNSTKEAETIVVPDGNWEILADGNDSLLWKKTIPAAGNATVAPISFLILGEKNVAVYS